MKRLTLRLDIAFRSNTKECSSEIKTSPTTIIARFVDLEWSKGRVKDYGNKRGWVLVCELIAPYHDAEIALLDDDDDRTSISEPYTINAAFFDCVLAAPAHLQTRKIKTRAEAQAGVGGRASGNGAAESEFDDE